MENKNLISAVIKVMNAVKSIEKNMTIGTGGSAYKGISDKDVKIAIGRAMEDNGLCILPISITPKIQVDRWDGLDYNGKPQVKQSVFTEVISEYLLCHSSGESQKIVGYGHGIDAQDKGAGKATTYALKNALLYTFMVATGKIDDTDNTHSDNIDTPNKVTKEDEKKFIPDIIEKIKKCNSRKELTEIFNSIPPTQQQAEHIISAFKKQNEEFIRINK